MFNAYIETKRQTLTPKPDTMTNQFPRTTRNDLSIGALDLFILMARDAPNWGGRPLIGGNFDLDAQDKGYLTKLKKADLVWGDEQYDPGCVTHGAVYINFTDAGKALAAELGIDLGCD